MFTPRSCCAPDAYFVLLQPDETIINPRANKRSLKMFFIIKELNDKLILLNKNAERYVRIAPETSEKKMIYKPKSMSGSKATNNHNSYSISPIASAFSSPCLPAFLKKGLLSCYLLLSGNKTVLACWEK